MGRGILGWGQKNTSLNCFHVGKKFLIRLRICGAWAFALGLDLGLVLGFGIPREEAAAYFRAYPTYSMSRCT